MAKDEKQICQSCAMPLEQTTSYGTNKDKSVNYEYCKFCFHNGQFTDEGITLEQKIQKNISIAKQMGIKEEEAKQMAESLVPKLKRWQRTSKQK